MKKTLFKNAVIVPMTERGQYYSYMGVEDGKISYLGNERPDANSGADTSWGEVDLGEKYVFPGLTDSHMHLMYSLVLSASAFDICKVTQEGIKPDNLAGVEKAIRDYVKENPKKNLIVANQYIAPAMKERRLPNRDELDDFASGREIVVFSIDGHSCAMSSALLSKLKIESTSGIMTGSEYDLSQGKITDYIASKVSLSTLIQGINNFENQCIKYGITRVCALDGDDKSDVLNCGALGDSLNSGAPGDSLNSGTLKKDSLLSILVFLARRMNIKVRLFPQYMNYDVLKKYGKKMTSKRIGGCSKWELDGSIGSHSAAFYHPFKDDGSITETYYHQELIDKKIEAALENGIALTCHAIGTKAIDQVVSSYEKCQHLIPKDGPMPRIDHFEFPSEHAMEFVKNHRLAVTLQPGYASLDKSYIKSYEKNLCQEDLDLICPLKDLSDSGVVILGSSDSPVQSINPYEQMRGMMEYYVKEQSIDAYDALKTYTYNPYLAMAENNGCLKVGNSADFFVTDKDITKLDKDAITQVVSEATYIDGVKIEKSDVSLMGLLLRKANKI